jgi:hypothetical protein
VPFGGLDEEGKRPQHVPFLPCDRGQRMDQPDQLPPRVSFWGFRRTLESSDGTLIQNPDGWTDKAS